jgi:multidrug efflux pump subunit AcrA (membrane-fusion protein)
MRANAVWLVAICAVALAGCQRTYPAKVKASAIIEPLSRPDAQIRTVRATGKIRAVKELAILAPQITGQLPGQTGRLTLTKLVANGTRVAAGDVVAEFDRTQQLDNAREAEAKYEDLAHQVEQQRAENRSNAEKLVSELVEAEADLAKAKLQMLKGPLLAEIDLLKAQVKLEDGQAHVASLQKSNRAHDLADQAALKILELQRDRQKVALERAQRNAEQLYIRAPLAGMVALENTWRSGTMGPPQEGDQVYPGQPLLRIFDPTEMEVRTMVAEPDGAVLVPGARAQVTLDVYPGLFFEARFQSASPVAASALGSPIKTFAARFRLEKTDPHLLPDLSAAVIISAERPKP